MEAVLADAAEFASATSGSMSDILGDLSECPPVPPDIAMLSDGTIRYMNALNLVISAAQRAKYGLKEYDMVRFHKVK